MCLISLYLIDKGDITALIHECSLLYLECEKNKAENQEYLL